MGMNRNLVSPTSRKLNAIFANYIRESERHLSRQREIELERHGPRDLLETFETAQSKHFNDRAHLLLALQEIT